MKKRARGDGSDSDDDGNHSTKKAPAAGEDTGNAYDSGDEVVATKEDDAFIDSDDDLKDIAKEYDEERQDFNDEHDDGFEDKVITVVT